MITGDWHSTFVNDLKADYEDEDAPVVATEFVGTSISSNGDCICYGPYYGPMIQFNPDIKFFDGDRRGYVLCKLDRDEWRTDLRMVLDRLDDRTRRCPRSPRSSWRTASRGRSRSRRSAARSTHWSRSGCPMC